MRRSPIVIHMNTNTATTMVVAIDLIHEVLSELPPTQNESAKLCLRDMWACLDRHQYGAAVRWLYRALSHEVGVFDYRAERVADWLATASL